MASELVEWFVELQESNERKALQPLLDASRGAEEIVALCDEVEAIMNPPLKIITTTGTEAVGRST